MLKDIVEVQSQDGYRLRVRFEDDVVGEIDVSQLVPLEGVFAPLKDRQVFEQVSVHPELGTICWPNGADLDPDVLYAHVTGRPIEATQREAESP